MDAKRIIVVGAGPAGMMAAIQAASAGGNVLLLEKNSCLGKKLLLSGKGRCNLTNACDLDVFLSRFSHTSAFLRDAFKAFFHVQLVDFFQSRGVAMKVERQGRVFPVSDKSSSVVKALEHALRHAKVDVRMKTATKDVSVKGDRLQGVVLSDGSILAGDRVILATGGMSYAATGSTGEGMCMAKHLGHRISVLRPGLVPLVLKEPFPRLLEGLTLKNIRLCFFQDNKRKESDIGELMFTRDGISGPLVLTLSGLVGDWLALGKHVLVTIDLKPGLSLEQLDMRMMRECRMNPKKELANIMAGLLPHRLINIILAIAKVDGHLKVSHLTQRDRLSLARMLKGWTMTVSRTRPLDEGMVTRGGISLKDINPRTMESRIIKGLYFAGEIIDVDADTGGFNLQAAFSTGFLAGKSAAA